MRNRTGKWYFTSESVTEGHPDKICDRISDSILDAMLEQDPGARVAVETLVTTGLVHVAGEVLLDQLAYRILMAGWAESLSQFTDQFFHW